METIHNLITAFEVIGAKKEQIIDVSKETYQKIQTLINKEMEGAQVFFNGSLDDKAHQEIISITTLGFTLHFRISK